MRLTPTTLTRASNDALEPRRRAPNGALAPLASVLCLALAGCSPPPPDTTPTTAAVCEALRPAMPIGEVQYHGKTVDADSKARIQAANDRIREADARFASACP